MPPTNTAEIVIHIDGTERPIDPSLLDFLREQTSAAIVERREKLGNGTGGLQEREELAVLYCQAVTIGLDHVTLRPFSELAPGLDEAEVARILDAKHSAARLIAWGRREAGLL